MNLIDIAEQTQSIALDLGAQEVEVNVSRAVSTEMGQRKGRIEKSKQARSMGISVQLLVDGRFSSHSASDARPEAMRSFLAKAIAATRSLESDPNRGLADVESMGSASVEIDIMDQSWHDRSPGVRRRELAELEESCLTASSKAPLRSVTVWAWDAMTESCKVCSNGHQSKWQRTSFGKGGEITLEDQDGRLPEAYDFYSSRHHEDLPDVELIAKSLVERGQRRIGSKAIKSQCIPMLLENRSVPRVLSVLTGPMNGSAIYEKRSCLMNKLGEKIGADGFDLIHDPHVPRGLASHYTDSDGLPTKRINLMKNGELQAFFISVYNSRRLKKPVTTGNSANLIVPEGSRSPMAILKSLPKAIRVDGFLGGNANPLTGDFSFGVNGILFEHGEPVQGISEMNISGNLFTLLPKWKESANDAWRYGSCRSPSLLFDNVQFSGT